MMSNGRIPAAQIGVLQCSTCQEPGVWEIVSCVQMIFDKLVPNKLKPVPVPMYRCIKCKGFLRQEKDGSYRVMHLEDGDEWKGE